MKEKYDGQSLYSKFLKITMVITLYWVVSISMVFMNKHLLSSPDYKLDAPLFITWFQCLVTFFLCLLLSQLTAVFPGISFPRIALTAEELKAVIPLSVIFVSMIAFNNLTLKNLGVAFYFVGRSLTTVFNVIFSYLILHQSTSIPAVVSCGVIVSGFFLGVDQEQVAGSLSIQGVLYGVCASLSVCFYSIYTKKVLPALDGSVIRLTFATNCLALGMFLPLIVIGGEVQAVWTALPALPHQFWACLVLSGAFGFAIGFVTSLQIQVTSPLTHNISGTAKACAQTVLAIVWFREYKPLLWWTSNILVLGGSAAYSRIRQLEMAKKHSANVLKT